MLSQLSWPNTSLVLKVVTAALVVIFVSAWNVAHEQQTHLEHGDHCLLHLIKRQMPGGGYVTCP